MLLMMRALSALPLLLLRNRYERLQLSLKEIIVTRCVPHHFHCCAGNMCSYQAGSNPVMLPGLEYALALSEIVLQDWVAC